MKKPEQKLAPLYPNNHTVSFMVLTGDFGSGKTSFALNIDPVIKGSGEGRTLHFDMENSAESFVNNYEFDRVDMPELTKEKNGENWTLGQLYRLWWETADQMTKDKHYRVLIIDDFSPLQEGAFSIAPGKDGMDKWSWTKNDIETKLRLLSTRVDTVVIIVHLRNKRDNSKEKEAKGIDTIRKLATLMLYLHRDPNKMIKIRGMEVLSCPKYPYPSGIVLKSRLEKVTDKLDEYGDPMRAPLIPDRIPVCTPGAIRKYMANPSVAFTYDEQMPDEIPGLVEPTTEQEVTQQKMEMNEQELKLALAEGRAQLADALIPQYYPDKKAILAASTELGIAYSLDTHEEMYNQLVAYAKETVYVKSQ